MNRVKELLKRSLGLFGTGYSKPSVAYASVCDLIHIVAVLDIIIIGSLAFVRLEYRVRNYAEFNQSFSA